VVVDELDPAFRITGLPGYPREAGWHALVQKAVAKRYAEEHGREYRELCLIVAHLGRGISVGAHRHGRVVAVNHALYEGPFSLERAGSLASSALLRLARQEADDGRLEELLLRGGGLIAHLGTTDLDAAYRLAAAGDQRTQQVLRSFAQGIAAEICARLPWFEGRLPDRVLLTGECSASPQLVQQLGRLLEPLGLSLKVYAGDQEMAALRDGALRVLKGVERPREYLESVRTHARP